MGSDCGFGIREVGGGILMSRVPKILAYVLFAVAALYVTALLYQTAGGH